MSARDYWENRYLVGDMPWEKGAPSPGLVDFLTNHPGLERGSVCVPGCGTGHDVRAFAAAGFSAHGIDLAPSAIEHAVKMTRKSGLCAEFTLGDFLHDVPPRQFDCLFEHTLFCAIRPEERDDYVRAVERWLRPGGTYLAVNYLLLEEGDGPPWRTSREEQMRRFSKEFDLLGDWQPRSYPNREGREWMFWWRRK